MLTIVGIVIKERPVGEQDKFIDVLTSNDGVIEITVKGARKINGKNRTFPSCLLIQGSAFS